MIYLSLYIRPIYALYIRNLGVNWEMDFNMYKVINLEDKELKKMLIKASEYRFGQKNGDCFLMTMCLSKYMFEEEGILLETHLGGIKKSSKNITIHMWSSYNGKRIDLTSHTQPDLRVNGMILDEPIDTETSLFGPPQNAKLIYIKDMNTRVVRDGAKYWIDRVKLEDKNDTTISHLLLQYIKTGIVPHEHLQKIFDYKVKRSPHLYRNFFNFMNEEKAVA